jgi:glucose-1-phosphate thymidylyltransferase
MKFAGIAKVYIVLRPGKWDIPAYFGDGSMLDMHLAYLTLGAPFGVPFTLDQAYPFVRQATVAFGFPDILYESDDGFAKLLARHSSSQADLALGLFPANHPLSKEDRVDFNDAGEVRENILMPLESRLRYSWAIAVWNPSFTAFLHDYVGNEKPAAAQSSELSAGHAIQAAIRAGLRVVGLILDENPYLDIGTPEGLREAMKRAV